MADIAAIDHVKIIRLHTRVPVAAPGRVNSEMVASLKVEGATTWVAVHANHPRELTAEARAACARLVDAALELNAAALLNHVRGLVRRRVEVWLSAERHRVTDGIRSRAELVRGSSCGRPLMGTHTGHVVVAEARLDLGEVGQCRARGHPGAGRQGAQG